METIAKAMPQLEVLKLHVLANFKRNRFVEFINQVEGLERFTHLRELHLDSRDVTTFYQTAFAKKGAEQAVIEKLSRDCETLRVIIMPPYRPWIMQPDGNWNALSGQELSDYIHFMRDMEDMGPEIAVSVGLPPEASGSSHLPTDINWAIHSPLEIPSPVDLHEEEWHELSDAESMSSSLSDGSANLLNDTPTALDTCTLAAKDQASSGSEHQYAAREIVRLLALHGCENLTDHIDEESFIDFPITGGAFGDVYRGSLRGGLKVAVKTPRILLHTLSENPEFLKDVAREIHTWKKCDHPHVLHFLGLVVFRGRIGMVAPWMDYGNLTSYLRRTMSVDRCKLCTEVCEGVAYLHTIGIVHGDLKGENILISSEGAAVVSDFGGSLLKNRSLKIMPLEKGLSLTSRWAAPELFEADDEDPANTKGSDIYALGMTILEAISGRPPWYWITRDVSIIRQVCSPRNRHKRPVDEIPVGSRDGDKLWNLLVSCWSFEPNARPTALEVGDIMMHITPGGLKVYPPPIVGGRCALFNGL
ncbi:tyrosine kinase catalytic domain protein [Rhizoctonia solani AG-3 Rhs1AP]|nr:tyrosine kinase catalytic domain protein [Rhizoctonia solani AG-3 Rhs1AP]